MQDIEVISENITCRHYLHSPQECRNTEQYKQVYENICNRIVGFQDQKGAVRLYFRNRSFMTLNTQCLDAHFLNIHEGITKSKVTFVTRFTRIVIISIHISALTIMALSINAFVL
jgi:hypothetical protein